MTPKGTKWDEGEYGEKKPITDEDKWVMAQYVAVGLRTGRRREDLNQELSERYGRSTRQIERYISKVKAIEEEEEPQQAAQHPSAQLAQPDPITIRRIRKHHRDMLHLVERWNGELNLSLWRNPIRDLGKPGIHWSKDSSLVRQVTEGGEVCLCHPLELSTNMETALVRGYLYQHLGTSTYSWLLDEMKKWKTIGGQEVARRCVLLNKIDKTTKAVTGFYPKDRLGAGPTDFFSNTIWAAVVDGVYRGLTYHPVENPQGGLYPARYGSFLIGLATTKEKGEKYQKWHKKLMVTFDNESLVRKIAKLKAKREQVTKAIQEELTKLIVAGHVPGECGGCPS